MHATAQRAGRGPPDPRMEYWRPTALRRPPSQSWRTFLTAVRAPQANASAERVVGTLRRACLDS